MRRLLAALLACGLLASMPGCGEPAPEARAVTSDEADRLAVARFLNYQDGGRAVDIAVPTSSGRMTVSASVDFTEHVGYGVLRTKGSSAPGSQGLVQWTLKALALRADQRPPSTQPASPPMGGWQGRRLEAKGSSLDTALLLVFSLASDRPENAQLLKQNGARWISTADVGGKKYDVFEGPKADGADQSRLHYYLDSSGKMAKVEAKLGTTEKPVVITFDRGKYTAVKPLRGMPR